MKRNKIYFNDDELEDLDILLTLIKTYSKTEEKVFYKIDRFKEIHRKIENERLFREVQKGD